MLGDFKKFILRGNVLDLAVAVVMGTAFNAVIQAIVKDLITPLIAAAVGKGLDFSRLSFTLHGSKLLYGEVINVVISFLSIAIVVFFLVVQPVNKLVALQNRNKKAPDPTEKKCPECLSTIPISATRCAFCTTKLKAA